MVNNLLTQNITGILIQVSYLRVFYANFYIGAELEVVESVQLASWLAENYTQFGATLSFITDKSSEGFQFVRGFGGIGGFMR